MDPSAALRNEIFRPLVTLVIPGATVVLPYVILINHYNPELQLFADKYPGLYLTLIGFAVLAAGFILENFGSLIELQIWDRLIERDTQLQTTDWHLFLCYAPEKEAVGHRYLRKLTLHLKFELAFGLALIFMWFGLIWLDAAEGLWQRQSIRDELEEQCDPRAGFGRIVSAISDAHPLFNQCAKEIARTRINGNRPAEYNGAQSGLHTLAYESPRAPNAWRFPAE